MTMSSPTTVHVAMHGVTMTFVAEFLSARLGRPVTDQTGIAGKYDIDLEAPVVEQAPAAPPGPSEASPPPPQSLPSMAFGPAIQQVGLKMEPRKGPVEYLVVDSSNKAPTAN